jgi:hypothetical protein
MLKFGLDFPTKMLYEFIASPYIAHPIVTEVLYGIFFSIFSFVGVG